MHQPAMTYLGESTRTWMATLTHQYLYREYTPVYSYLTYTQRSSIAMTRSVCLSSSTSFNCERRFWRVSNTLRFDSQHWILEIVFSPPYRCERVPNHTFPTRRHRRPNWVKGNNLLISKTAWTSQIWVASKTCDFWQTRISWLCVWSKCAVPCVLLLC